MTNTQIAIKKTAEPAANTNNSPDVWHAFRYEMDRMFDRVFEGFKTPSLYSFANVEHFWPRLSNGFSAAVDLTADDKAYKVAAELPGIDDKDVEVTVGEDYVTIKGEKHAEKESKEKDQFIRERSYGIFQRTFALPADVDRKAIDAKFTKGVLTVTLPKAVKAEFAPKKIDVRAA